MSPRDLLQNPCWHADDLGQALPDSPHAVSVALPRWQDVIAYEEKEPACLNALRAIYPRFGLNPLVAEVAQQALAKHGPADGSAWPYPTAAAAGRAQHHCQRIEPMAFTAIKTVRSLPCLITDAKAASAAKAFWQHSGLGASSRQAASALEREPAPSLHASVTAQNSLRQRLAEIYRCNQELVQLHPSGMAALTKALEAITALRPGRPFLQLGFPYVDVLKLPQEVFGGSDLLLTTESKLLAVEF
ncbi:MAG: PLP-dependent transferase, partial [Prochlorococcus sp.]